MHLDGFFPDVELCGDLLVHHAGCEQSQYLALAGGELCQARIEGSSLAMLRAIRSVPGDGFTNSLNKVDGLYRLVTSGVAGSC